MLQGGVTQGASECFSENADGAFLGRFSRVNTVLCCVCIAWGTGLFLAFADLLCALSVNSGLSVFLCFLRRGFPRLSRCDYLLEYPEVEIRGGNQGMG